MASVGYTDGIGSTASGAFMTRMLTVSALSSRLSKDHP